MPDSANALPGSERPAPAWLAQRLQQRGGSVPFRTYMDWALNDPDHGAYASGRLRIGPRGDFTTAPSLSDDFAALLVPQLAAWLEQLGPGPLALIEAGPGEGAFAADLAAALAAGWPQLAARTHLVLVDPSEGLVERQRQRLAGCPLPVRWTTFEQLAAQPVVGVVLAHEVLDALPVERIVWDGAQWRRQHVALRRSSQTAAQGPVPQPGKPACGEAGDPAPAPGLQVLELVNGEPLGTAELAQLALLGVAEAAPQRPAGWCTELHPGLAPWLRACGAGLSRGLLLVIDYALEACRYYAPQRSRGTLMAYRAQQASADPLLAPGCWDLTAHLCLESLSAAAASAGWSCLGQTRQGEALLALGLAQRLHGLQQRPELPLAELLARREALLRLVDPMALGDFRWIGFVRGAAVPQQLPLFLQEPPLA